MPLFAIRLLTEALLRIFLLAVIFAVLWTKGYLWWVVGIAVFLYLVSAVSSLNRVVVHAHTDDEDGDDDKNSDTGGTPSLPPSTRP